MSFTSKTSFFRLAGVKREGDMDGSTVSGEGTARGNGTLVLPKEDRDGTGPMEAAGTSTLAGWASNTSILSCNC